MVKSEAIDRKLYAFETVFFSKRRISLVSSHNRSIFQTKLLENCFFPTVNTAVCRYVLATYNRVQPLFDSSLIVDREIVLSKR